MNAPIHPSAELALAKLWASPAIVAFIHRRLEQMAKFGHTIEADLASPVDRLPRQAMQRVHDVVETLGRDTAHVARDQREAMLRKIEVAGALLLAAHDRIRADILDHERSPE